jgi:hypothetical protein
MRTWSERVSSPVSGIDWAHFGVGRRDILCQAGEVRTDSFKSPVATGNQPPEPLFPNNQTAMLSGGQWALSAL